MPPPRLPARQDFIIAPGPEADTRLGPPVLLAALVARLRAAGYADPASAHMLHT